LIARRRRHVLPFVIAYVMVRHVIVTAVVTLAFALFGLFDHIPVYRPRTPSDIRILSTDNRAITVRHFSLPTNHEVSSTGVDRRDIPSPLSRTPFST
jgi:hypothetical protein